MTNEELAEWAKPGKEVMVSLDRFTFPIKCCLVRCNPTERTLWRVIPSNDATTKKMRISMGRDFKPESNYYFFFPATSFIWAGEVYK